MDKRLAAQFRGYLSKSQGENFEELIQAACEYYRIKGMAEIEKTPEPMKPVKNLGDGKFIAYFVKSAQADFKGVIKGGKAIAFEAKSTRSGKLLQSVVTPEQERQMNAMYKMGAICFVLCSFEGKGFYRIPWEVWENMKELYGHKYITPENVREHEIRITPGGVLKFLEESRELR